MEIFKQVLQIASVVMTFVLFIVGIGIILKAIYSLFLFGFHADISNWGLVSLIVFGIVYWVMVKK
jgi:multidrug transporter EmrE-like cation transporter